MPVQTQNSSFAKKMGARVAQANAEHKDKPIDTGFQQLPPGIKGGIAKLTAMYTSEYADDKNGTKGQTFFRASASVMSPEAHNGIKVLGGVTSVVIPLCDVPAKGFRKASTFDDNYFKFQNTFKLLGIAPCPHTPQTDPTGQQTEAYFFGAMKTLMSKPTYVSFSTRGYTPPKTPQNPNPAEMTFEDWHGLADWNGKHDPAAGVTVASQPDVNTPPPTGQAQTLQEALQTQPPQAATNYQTSPAATPPQPSADVDPADQVAALLEVLAADPKQATSEGRAAAASMEALAVASGWTEAQVSAAADWTAVGDMILTAPPLGGTQEPAPPPTTGAPAPAVTVGSKWKYAKRTKDGAKLKNAANVEFPAFEVEVSSVDAAAGTCHVKELKNGREIVDIRTKKPVDVKLGWLEPIAY